MVRTRDRLPVSSSSQSPGFPAAEPGREGGESACSFGGFRLENDGTLWRGESVVHLPPKELAALQLLLANAGQVVSPLQLKHALWGDVHVTADSVPRCMSSLRARLEPESCIQTVYKRGYRFTAGVLRQSDPPAGALPRLAILPFANEYSVPEHLGHAIAEETVARLSNAHFPSLSVLARDSVYTLAGRGFTAQQIGQMLKADLVLTGTLRAFSSQFRLRAEMIRVEDGVQVWVEDLLVDRDRLAGLESELLERLAFRLTTGVPGDRSSSPGWSSGVPGDRSSSPGQNEPGLEISAVAAGEADFDRAAQRREAYDTFLRGHYEWQTLHRHRMQDGLQLLLRAIELDPSLTSAKVDLAHMCITQASYGYVPPTVAADHIHRIEESIPDLAQRAPEFLPALGWINFHFDRNLPAALQAFSSSSHLPQGPWITRLRSIFTLSRHRFPEAISQLRAAIQNDPYSPWLQSRLAWALHLNGQASESVDQIQSALKLFSENEYTRFYGALILAYNSDFAHATQLAAELAQRLPFFDPANAIHAYTLACAGRKDEARAILERLQWLSRERYLLNCFNPAIHVALGELDAAIEELRTANERRCPWFFQMLADPRLKPLHGRPEFERMRSILGYMEAEAKEARKIED
ncbi:MAG: winged helix-turn-helix domain-containing protein [Terracidiphilus sp.]